MPGNDKKKLKLRKWVLDNFADDVGSIIYAKQNYLPRKLYEVYFKHLSKMKKRGVPLRDSRDKAIKLLIG